MTMWEDCPLSSSSSCNEQDDASQNQGAGGENKVPQVSNVENSW